MKKFKVGELIIDQFGKWFQVKDVRNDGFIAVRTPSGCWEYRDPSEFKSLEKEGEKQMFKVVEVKKQGLTAKHWNIDFDGHLYVTVWSNEISAKKICDYLNSGK